MSKYEGHTPGPWRRAKDNKWAVIAEDRTVICRMQPWDETGCRIDDNADADLVADAPKLLAECARLREALEIVDARLENLGYMVDHDVDGTSIRGIIREALKEVGDDE